MSKKKRFLTKKTKEKLLSFLKNNNIKKNKKTYGRK